MKNEEIESLCIAGERFLQAGDLNGASQYCRKALTVDSGIARALNSLALIACKGGSAEEAISLFWAAHLARPKDERIIQNLIVVLRAVGKVDQAKAICEAFLRAVPGSVEISSALDELLKTVPPDSGVRGPKRQNKPFPSKKSVLERLIAFGVKIDTVIDVGVHEVGTAELITSFPQAKHLLFEPVDIYFDQIRKLYENVDYELFPVACSDVNGECFLKLYTSEGNGKVTHAAISDKFQESGEGNAVVACKRIREARLDDLELDLKGEVLLKVDVDGVELKVLAGAERILERASVVIVEGTVGGNGFFERSDFLRARGFELFDVVDLAYYKSTLSQADLVFVSRRLKETNPRFSPWKGARERANFMDPSEWVPIL